MALGTKSQSRPEPRRQAAQAGDAESPDVDLERLVLPCAVLFTLWIVAGIEWLWSLGPRSLNPIYTTLIAALMTVYVGGRTWPDLKKLARYRPGQAREPSVAGELAALRRLGCRVCRNVPLDSGNVDYVVIGSHGIFAIVVRARSLPLHRERRVRYDGTAVSINDGPADASVIQAPQAQARQLKRLLKELTGLALPVRAVLLYPGWNVDSLNAREHSDAWVLAPRSLAMWIRHEPETVNPKELRRIAGELDSYIARHR